MAVLVVLVPVVLVVEEKVVVVAVTVLVSNPSIISYIASCMLEGESQTVTPATHELAWASGRLASERHLNDITGHARRNKFYQCTFQLGRSSSRFVNK